VGTLLEHMTTEVPATSHDVLPPVVIRSELTVRKPDFMILKEDCDYDSAVKVQLVEENKKLRLELNLA